LFCVQFLEFVDNNPTHQQRECCHDDQRLNDVGVGRVDLVEAKPRFEFFEQQFDLPARPIELCDIGRVVVLSVQIRQVQMVLAAVIVANAD